MAQGDKQTIEDPWKPLVPDNPASKRGSEPAEATPMSTSGLPAAISYRNDTFSKLRKLISRCRELSDRQRDTRAVEAADLTQDAVDCLLRGGQPTLHILERVENLQVEFQRAASGVSMTEADFYAKLRDLGAYLEAAKAILPEGEPKREHKKFRYSSKNPKSRAKTVARLKQELDTLKRSFIGGEADYQQLKGEHPGFLVFQISEANPDVKKKVLCLDQRRQMTHLAIELAAAYHSKSPATIESDWKKHKPHSLRRKS